ncbi:MAG: ABC transporter permease, partial [Pseudomonadota bacterium]
MMWSALLRLIDRWSPALVAALFLAVWELLVGAFDVPVFILPAPSAIGASFVDDGPMLLSALRVTIALTLKALFFAVVA